MIGDMDARFGEAVRHLLTLMDPLNIEEFSHPSIPDNVNVPYVYNNAELLATTCIDKQLFTRD